jgi:SAM-dependent methyltransferase
MFVCPRCKSSLDLGAEAHVQCASCGERYDKDRYGYWVLVADPQLKQLETTTDDYATTQETSGARVYDAFLKPLIELSGAKCILDVGCGQGSAIAAMGKEGRDAYGIDLPTVTRYWDASGNDRGHFFASSATDLPFADESFDFVYSFGVIEHIGTVNGHIAMADDYRQKRLRYASELMRVVRPGGQLLLACPNKRFPLDIQHGALDGVIEPTLSRRLREAVFRKTRVNVHPIFGEQHLLSYGEVREMFAATGKLKTFEPLSLQGYFGFAGFNRGVLKWVKKGVELYATNLPAALRSSFLNPYMLVRVTR